MRKQTKLVAVLSAAALLAMGASMTSFAAGWQKDDAGVWHYYDSDDEMVTGEWKKDGGKWFHLDDEGDMETNTWVDDDYYVGEDGAMLTNAWKYTMSDDDQDDPDSDGKHWYYFNNKGKKVADQDKNEYGSNIVCELRRILSHNHFYHAVQLFHHKLHDVLEKSRYFRSMLHRPVCRNRKRKDQQKYDQETDMGCGNPHRLSEKLIGKDAVNHKINVSRTI